MAYGLNVIYGRASGYCPICGRKVCFSNYGIIGARGAWEIEDSRPRARGGTNHGNNLYAACIPSNREKSHRWSTRTVRGWNGRTRAPLSRAKRAEARQRQALAGAVLFGVAGSVFGLLVAIAGVALGAAFGDKQNPDRT